MNTPLTVADVISLAGSFNFNQFCASQTPNDIEILSRTCKKLPTGATYLEVGVRDGVSAITALLSNFGLEVYGVDIDANCGRVVGSNIQTIESNARLSNYYSPDKWKLVDRFHFLPGDSVEVSKGWEKDIDFLFIDGHHSAENCTRDFNAWSPFLKSGSYLGFHDYIFYEHVDMQVKTAVDNLLKNVQGWYFIGASEQVVMFLKK